MLLLSIQHPLSLFQYHKKKVIVFSILELNCCVIDKVLIDLKYEDAHALL